MSEKILKAQRVLKKSLKTLKINSKELSFDLFVVATIDLLMLIERDEFIKRVNDPNKNKGNGYYNRCLNGFSKDIVVFIPRVRVAGFSPITLKLAKLNYDNAYLIIHSLYKDNLTSEKILTISKTIFGKDISKKELSSLVKIFNLFRVSWQDNSLEPFYKKTLLECISKHIKFIKNKKRKKEKKKKRKKEKKKIDDKKNP